MPFEIPDRVRNLMLAVAVLLGMSALGVGWAAGEVVMVANSGVADDVLGEKAVERIYLGKKTTWTDHSSIIPVMLKAGPVHREFVEEIVGRSEHRFASYWRQMVFTGKGIPPRSFETEVEVVDFVKDTPGAVGYVSPATDVTGVKVLSVD